MVELNRFLDMGAIFSPAFEADAYDSMMVAILIAVWLAMLMQRLAELKIPGLVWITPQIKSL